MVLPDDFTHLSAAGIEDVIEPLVEQGRGLRHPASYDLQSSSSYTLSSYTNTYIHIYTHSLSSYTHTL